MLVVDARRWLFKGTQEVKLFLKLAWLVNSIITLSKTQS